MSKHKNWEVSRCFGMKMHFILQKSLPVEDLTIVLPESVKLMPFGKVSSIIENLGKSREYVLVVLSWWSHLKLFVLELVTVYEDACNTDLIWL